MGGCISTFMLRKSQQSEVPHPYIQDYLKYGPLIVEQEPAPDANSSPVYRCAHATASEHTWAMKELYYHSTLVRDLETVCKASSSKRAIAYRPIEKVTQEERTDEKGIKKTWEVTHLKPAEFLSYDAFWECVVNFGRGIRCLGLSCTRVALYEETRYEWLAALYGLWSQDLTAVTVYANLGESALQFAFQQTEVHVVLCNGRNVPRLVRILSEKSHPEGCTLIYLDELPEGYVPKEGFQVLSWYQLQMQGATEDYPLRYPSSADAIGVIMYTSGTTNDPKGVELSHGTIYSGVWSLNDRVKTLLGPLRANESYLAYLPLAHIMEFACEAIFLSRGARLCYGSPRTLTDTTARPHGDLQEYQPHVLCGVPRVFDTIKKAIESKLPAPGSTKRKIYELAYQNRLACLRRGMETPYWNQAVFGKARALFGGQLRFVICGGAPMSATTQEFMNVVVGSQIIPGYGLTETVACCSVMHSGDMTSESTGELLKGLEVRLQDVAEWKHSDTPYPRGEICIRGPCLAKGYFQQPEESRSAFVDGWFHTGDVGLIASDGSLRIIGRVKALAKNVLGEYVAMESLEAVYGANPLAMPNGVCVLVHPQRPYIAALVLTDEAKAMAFAKENHFSGTYAELLQKPAFHQAAATSLSATAKAAGRKPFEFVKHVLVLSDEWTTENDILTAAMKLKRRSIEQRYATQIEALFAEE